MGSCVSVVQVCFDMSQHVTASNFTSQLECSFVMHEFIEITRLCLSSRPIVVVHSSLSMRG